MPLSARIWGRMGGHSRRSMPKPYKFCWDRRVAFNQAVASVLKDDVLTFQTAELIAKGRPRNGNGSRQISLSEHRLTSAKVPSSSLRRLVCLSSLFTRLVNSKVSIYVLKGPYNLLTNTSLSMSLVSCRTHLNSYMRAYGRSTIVVRSIGSTASRMNDAASSNAASRLHSDSEPATHFKITLRRSAISLGDRIKATLVSLGIHRRHQTVYYPHSPVVAGKILRVKELVEVENVPSSAVRTSWEQRQERKAVRGYQVVGTRHPGVL